MVRLATIKGLAVVSYFLMYLRKGVCVCLSVCVASVYAKGMFVVDKSLIDVWGLGVWVYGYVLWNRGNSVTSSLLKGLDSSKEYLCFFVTSS